jgi:hypothetical protein
VTAHLSPPSIHTNRKSLKLSCPSELVENPLKQPIAFWVPPNPLIRGVLIPHIIKRIADEEMHISTQFIIICAGE